MDFERFSGKKILLAESSKITGYMQTDGKEQYNVDFVADWVPFETPGLAQYMRKYDILAGVIHPNTMHEELILKAHSEGANLLILYSLAVDLERNQMLHRLLGRGLSVVSRPYVFSPKVLLEAVGNMLDWQTS